MTNPHVNRLAQQKSSVVEVHLARWPEPPRSLMSMPGMREWWKEMVAIREKDQETLYKMALTKQP